MTRAAGYVPPRLELDSSDMTHIGSPPPKLLAIARGEEPKAKTRAPAPSRKVVWFALGMIVGGLAVWSVTSDVRADVYSARIWVADSLRSLHGGAKPTSAVEAPSPAPELTLPKEPAPASRASAAKTASSKVSASIPTIDVGALPRSQGAPSSSLRSQSTGAPVLANAPGPR